MAVLTEPIVVSLQRDGGPVSVRVTPRSPLQGSGLLTRLNRLSLKSSLLVRLTIDGVPVELPLEIEAQDLPDYMLTIHGSYAPAPGHDRIAVSYSFVQNGALLPMSSPAEIAEVGDETEAQDFRHLFEFSY